MQNEVKILLVTMEKGECQEILKEPLPHRLTKKHPHMVLNAHEEKTKGKLERRVKPTMKCWKCGDNHYLSKCPTRGSKKYENNEILKLVTKMGSKTVERVLVLSNLNVDLGGRASRSCMERSDGPSLENMT